MKLSLIAMIVTLLVLSSCSTQNYLNQANHASPDKTGLLITQTALIRPEFSSKDMQKQIDINRANELAEREKSEFLTKLNNSVNHIITKANSFLGTPYRYGGTTRRGIDCSSFMQQIYEVEGIYLPRVSAKQAKIGIPVSKSELQKGDLVFFSTTSRYRVTHVGMVVDVQDNDITFIHAASSKGVSKASLNHPYWRKRYRSARRPNQLAQPFERHYANIYNDSVRTLASLRN